MQKTGLLVLTNLFIFLSFISETKAESYFFFPKQVENQRVDSLISRAGQLYDTESFDQALEIYLSAKEISLKEKYSKGLTHSYLGISGVYFMKGELALSTSYLMRAKQEPFAKQDLDVLYSISFREGLNLHMLGLYDEAIKLYKEAIKISDKISNEEERIDKLAGVYINMGDVYQLKKQNDSALYYYKSAYYSPTTNLNNKFTSSVSISEMYTGSGELDSSKIYLMFAEGYSEKLGSNYSAALLNEVYGKFYDASGDLQRAISSYQKALQLNREIKNPREGLYKLLSEAYKKKGNEELANDYLHQYVVVKDSLDEARKQNIQVPAILAKSENKMKVEQAEANARIIFILSGLLIIGTLAGGYLYLKRQRKKSLKGKRENIQLKKKLNNAFEEVVELANLNSPNFLSRFIEVYPEFYTELIHNFPDLTTADLKLCALMKLDFSTKEIAEITFSSLRTVQNRKYKLRKKFNLSSEENLNQWVQNFHVETLDYV